MHAQRHFSYPLTERFATAPQATAGASLVPVSPLLAVSRGMRPAPVRGVGYDMTTTSMAPSISAGVGIVLLGLSAALSYYAGAAMTPSGGKKTTWGIVGIPVGLLTGPIGLGVMGIVAMKKK